MKWLTAVPSSESGLANWDMCSSADPLPRYSWGSPWIHQKRNPKKQYARIKSKQLPESLCCDTEIEPLPVFFNVLIWNLGSKFGEHAHLEAFMWTNPFSITSPLMFFSLAAESVRQHQERALQDPRGWREWFDTHVLQPRQRGLAAEIRLVCVSVSTFHCRRNAGHPGWLHLLTAVAHSRLDVDGLRCRSWHFRSRSLNSACCVIDMDMKMDMETQHTHTRRSLSQSLKLRNSTIVGYYTKCYMWMCCLAFPVITQDKHMYAWLWHQFCILFMTWVGTSISRNVFLSSLNISKMEDKHNGEKTQHRSRFIQPCMTLVLF